MPASASRPASSAVGITTPEFIVVVGSLMAVNTLGVDIMLPALPEIARSLELSGPNQQQWVITAYLLSAGVLQIVFGPLSDRYGRRLLTIGCLFLYALMSLAAAFAPSFAVLIAARILQGVGAAGTRVLATAMVRDRFAGTEMARILSLCFIVLLMAPLLAPSIGSLVMLVAPWQGIYVALGIYALVVAAWILARMPETLAPERQRSMRFSALGEAALMVVRNRKSAGYATGAALSMGAVVGYITCSQQIYAEALAGPVALFSLYFSALASGMVMASFANSRLVMRLGARAVSHIAVIAYCTLGVLHILAAAAIGDTLPVFTAFQFAMLFCLGLIGANFSAMAMEPMGAIPGMAAAIQGLFSSLVGAGCGIVIGQSFDGTTLPVNIGNLACGIGMMLAALHAGRRPRSAPQAAKAAEAAEAS